VFRDARALEGERDDDDADLGDQRLLDEFPAHGRQQVVVSVINASLMMPPKIVVRHKRGETRLQGEANRLLDNVK